MLPRNSLRCNDDDILSRRLSCIRRHQSILNVKLIVILAVATCLNQQSASAFVVRPSLIKTQTSAAPQFRRDSSRLNLADYSILDDDEDNLSVSSSILPTTPGPPCVIKV